MSSCILCKDMPCCPEHCCNWDDCECGDCDACVVKPQVQPLQPKPVIQESVKIILLGNSGQKKTQIAEEVKIEPKVPIQSMKSFEKEENKSENSEVSPSLPSPKAAGNGIFGIRYLRKKK